MGKIIKGGCKKKMPPRGRPRRTRVFKKASIGRFNGEYKDVAFKEGDLVNDLLSRASISLHSGDEINDDMGNVINANDKAKETTYHITGNLKNGQ